MRYIEGTDLGALLVNGARLDPKRAMAGIAQVSDALDEGAPPRADPP
jgi:hypothetical protein